MRNNFVVIFISLIFCEPFDGYTLITNMNSNQGGSNQNRVTHLVDNNQNIINSWIHDTGIASIAYLTSDSLLYVPCKIPNQNGGGQGQGGGGPGGGRFKIINWVGDIIWDYYLPEEICSPHHDIAVLPNGNILAICGETKTQQEALDMGILSINGPMTLDMIVEIEPVGSNGGNIIWKWHFWDRLIQDVNPFASNYAIISDNPHLLDINCQSNSGSGAGGLGISDWNHCNCISYNETYDQIVISSRHMSEFYVIDHSTTIEEAASHSGGIYGKGGDFLYRWGNPQNYNIGSSQILDAQHGVNWIPEGYPGEGKFILFNNLHGAGGSSSAILEIESIMDENGFYPINQSGTYGPSSFSWIYQPSSLFSNFQSGAFRLPNGNTLITSTSQQDVFEINQLGEIEWTYTGNLITARAIKYPLDYFDLFIFGDINEDLQINVLDIVMLVNVVLNLSESNSYCDLNDDEVVNILDVVQLVNLIVN